MSAPLINQPAPTFELAGSDGKIHRLEQYRDHWVVLYFYPKDNTPGCTLESCQFRDAFNQILRLNGVILGINTDSVQSHKIFGKKYQLPFPLLSDADGKISQQYGCLFKLGPIKFCKRQSFIIDPAGNLAKIYRQVSPTKHASEIIEFLQQASRQQ
jgi:peroxiredoxin Q/BCP